MLEIQLSKGEYLLSHNQFSPATFLCLSQTRAWILIIMCCGLFVLNDLKWEVIVYFVTLFFLYWWNRLKFIFIIYIQTLQTEIIIQFKYTMIV